MAAIDVIHVECPSHGVENNGIRYRINTVAKDEYRGTARPRGRQAYSATNDVAGVGAGSERYRGWEMKEKEDAST